MLPRDRGVQQSFAGLLAREWGHKLHCIEYFLACSLVHAMMPDHQLHTCFQPAINSASLQR